MRERRLRRGRAVLAAFLLALGGCAGTDWSASAPHGGSEGGTLGYPGTHAP